MRLMKDQVYEESSLWNMFVKGWKDELAYLKDIKRQFWY